MIRKIEYYHAKTGKIPDEQGFLLGVFFYNIMLRNEDGFRFGDFLELKISSKEFCFQWSVSQSTKYDNYTL